jgi:glycogen(starch) synthase
LIEAIKLLRDRWLFPNLTIVGAGPDLHKLRLSVPNRQLTNQIEFVGLRTGQELRLLLHRHRTIVVPSRWKEPFGLVALEGVACGCRAIVASDGGLPEVMKPLALAFERKNVPTLADAIERNLSEHFDWEAHWPLADEMLLSYRAMPLP